MVATTNRKEDSKGRAASKKRTIKQKLRDVIRLQAKSNVDAALHVELERRAAALRAEAEENQKRQKEKRMTLKYKKVRFFERRKLERRLVQAKKELERDPSNPAIEEKLKVLAEDLEYVKHFPAGQKYVSILVGESSDIKEKRESIRSAIKIALQKKDVSVLEDCERKDDSASEASFGSLSASEVDVGNSSDSTGLDTKDHLGSSSEEEDAFFLDHNADDITERGERASTMWLQESKEHYQAEKKHESLPYGPNEPRKTFRKGSPAIHGRNGPPMRSTSGRDELSTEIGIQGSRVHNLKNADRFNAQKEAREDKMTLQAPTSLFNGRKGAVRKQRLDKAAPLRTRAEGGRKRRRKKT